MELLQAYLDNNPTAIKQGAVTDCLCLFYGGKIQGGHCPVPVVCYLEALPDKERDDCAMRLATSYLKEDNLREAVMVYLAERGKPIVSG